MAKSNTVCPKINLDNFCKDFLSSRTFHNFEMLTEESYKKMEEVENNLNKIIAESKEIDKELYAYQLITNLKHMKSSLNGEEQIFLLIKLVDPECLTYKYYINHNIPSVREYEKAYMTETNQFLKKQARLLYEEKVKQRNNVIQQLRTKLLSKIGVFLPSLIKYEKAVLHMQKNGELETSIEKDYIKQLFNFLDSLNFISPLSNEAIDRLNIEIEKYKLLFPILDINLLTYHILNQSNILGLKNMSEQIFFLLNTINSYKLADENLIHIVEYNCTWDSMNQELKQNYGIKSEPLLRLQNHYNKIYNIKGDF